jgi:hypothetical protein
MRAGTERRRFHHPSAWWKGADWTWQAVQDRMAEAMRHWWRSHDSEARFSLGGRIIVGLAPGVHRQAGADRTAGHGAEPAERRCRCRAPTWRGWSKRPNGCASCREADRRLVVLVLV